MGSDAMREALLGQTYPASWIDVVLDERFLRGGAYFIPDGSVDWDAADIGARYVPPPAAGADPGAWRRGDEVFVPCRDSDGRILAVISLGEPVSGRRSSDDELDFLVAVGRHAALALEQAHRTEEASRHRAALEHLFAVSSKLAGKSSIDSVLRAVCGGVRRALGFRKVLIELVDPVTGTLSPAATAGWPGSEAPSWDVPVAEVERLLDPEFEIGGCYLMPGAAGRARAGHDHVAPEGERNGRPARVGPPLAVRAALRPGRARARPHLGRRARRPVVASRARLEALALFAGQATTAIVSARQLEQLRALADQDPLTGLPNRRAFVRVLENEFTRARRYGHPLALVLGDVDAFKQINDTYGHPGGDRALRAVADALRAGLRETDGAFRIGGDEFAGILPMTTGREAHAAVRRLEDRFRAGAPEPFIAEVHMSCGFATLRGGPADADALIQRADVSRYAAKRARMAAR
ncbi:MAG TPA: GGDEF domain-containing protein [Solirubrobacteraceae bacterium]|nr:GGDEF domain-containing protein [Solirubrobacteraceae bacterium]